MLTVPNERELQKIAQFEERMEVLAKDNPDLAKACRHAHTTFRAAKHVAESIFNDDVAEDPQVVIAIHAAIADDLEDLRGDEDDEADEGSEDDY